jgi:Cellulase (glycosyl hydrolase family 5)
VDNPFIMKSAISLFIVCVVIVVTTTLWAQSTRPLDWIRLSDDKHHFVSSSANTPINIWGFNYDRDDSGRLIEDYWDTEWPAVAQDFAEMKALRANVVRVHLQFAKFMDGPDRPNRENLARLQKLVALAESARLYLDLTGLGCYHKQDVPAWYDAMDETARWQAQSNFWRAIAGVCKSSPAVFCYDLMNEPILGGGQNPKDWLPGPPLAGMYYVQRITTDMRGRNDAQVAGAWVKTLTSAIREVDDRHLITVGEIPWAQVFKGAKPLFGSKEVGGPLDFVSVHFYPKPDALEGSMAALRVYEVGKPLVVEEIFPLNAGIDQTTKFIDTARPEVDGWVSFYWGKTIEQNKAKATTQGTLTGDWLERFSSMAPR